MVGKIGDFAELTSPADGDLFEVVDVSDATDDASGSTRRIAWSTFKAAFVEVSGDTMTGNLTLAGGFPQLVLNGTTQNYINFQDGNTGFSGYRIIYNIGSERVEFQQYDPATGTLQNYPLLLESDGSVNMGLATSVSVPDATADGEALNRQTADARYGDRLWLGAADLNITDGSPVLDAVFASRNVGWKMFDTGLQLVAGSVVIPAGWSSYDVNVWWYTSATAGDVVLRRRVFGKAPGDDGGTGAGNVDTTATVAGVANEITSTTIASANTQGVGGSDIAFLEVGRFANDAADTATSTVFVLGVELVRVS